MSHSDTAFIPGFNVSHSVQDFDQVVVQSYCHFSCSVVLSGCELTCWVHKTQSSSNLGLFCCLRSCLISKNVSEPLKPLQIKMTDGCSPVPSITTYFKHIFHPFFAFQKLLSPKSDKNAKVKRRVCKCNMYQRVGFFKKRRLSLGNCRAVLSN